MRHRGDFPTQRRKMPPAGPSRILGSGKTRPEKCPNSRENGTSLSPLPKRPRKPREKPLYTFWKNSKTSRKPLYCRARPEAIKSRLPGAKVKHVHVDIPRCVSRMQNPNEPSVLAQNPRPKTQDPEPIRRDEDVPARYDQDRGRRRFGSLTPRLRRVSAEIPAPAVRARRPSRPSGGGDTARCGAPLRRCGRCGPCRCSGSRSPQWRWSPG